ncbi:MAG: alpha-L-fucosidase [Candidatus Hydrogenedentes bacterium]|nr:alpha-L-fucosidase [Candidatus Hydrogenedentota bacterium]
MNVLLLAAAVLAPSMGAYEATWESIDSRPNPQWFEDAKFGIFIHWGVYSVPSWGPKTKYAEWYWHDMMNADGETWKFHEQTYGKDFKYQDFAPLFTAEMFDPAQWADVFARSGAKYIVLTSKHHEGFCLWPNQQAWNWNAVDAGPHRDLAGDLIKAVHERGLRMGFYYSIYEWFNPLYKEDVNKFVDEHMLPQLKDLVERYKPDVVWPDGEWDHPSSVWKSTEFLAWLFNESSAPKDVVINDRWGKECRNVHGGFATPEYGGIPEGHLIQTGFFEECQGMGHSFGYNRNEDVDSYRSAAELLHLLIDNVSRGGNLLLDIGPTADGRIPVIMQQRLIDMGKWLEVNHDAIYGTEKWDQAPQMDKVRFTKKGDEIYAICLEWPGKTLEIPKPAGAAAVAATFLGHDGNLDVEDTGNAWKISIPQLSPAEVPCQHAWVIRLQ